MLRVLTGRIEKCSKSKEKVQTICPHIWIHYIIDGKGFYNGQALGKGDAFIVYTGDYCEYEPDREDPWTYIWIRLYGEDVERMLEKCAFPRDSGVFIFSYSDKLVDICSFAFDDENKCERYLDENRIYAEALCKLILSLNADEVESDRCDSRECWVRRAKEYIRANYHHRLRVEEIADILHVDRKYLRNLFVEYTGVSTQQYVVNIRLRRAKDLLLISDASVGVIANSVGYSDALCFSRIFKKHVGISPSEYRRRYKT